MTYIYFDVVLHRIIIEHNPYLPLEVQDTFKI